MKKKLFYRVANNKTQQGLWYDFNGKFTGFIASFFYSSKMAKSLTKNNDDN